MIKYLFTDFPEKVIGTKIALCNKVIYMGSSFGQKVKTTKLADNFRMQYSWDKGKLFSMTNNKNTSSTQPNNRNRHIHIFHKHNIILLKDYKPSDIFKYKAAKAYTNQRQNIFPVYLTYIG